MMIAPMTRAAALAPSAALSTLAGTDPSSSHIPTTRCRQLIRQVQQCFCITGASSFSAAPPRGRVSSSPIAWRSTRRSYCDPGLHQADPTDRAPLLSINEAHPSRCRTLAVIAARAIPHPTFGGRPDAVEWAGSCAVSASRPFKDEPTTEWLLPRPEIRGAGMKYQFDRPGDLPHDLTLWSIDEREGLAWHATAHT